MSAWTDGEPSRILQRPESRAKLMECGSRRRSRLAIASGEARAG